MDSGRRPVWRNHGPVLWLEDLVKDAAIGEMGFLGLLPAAEHFINRDEFQRRKLARIFRSSPGISRPVKIPPGDVLAFIRIKIIEIGFGNLERAVLLGDLLDHGHRRFGQNAQGRSHDVEFVRAKLFDRQMRLVFPGQQNVPDAAFRERRCGTARAGIENRYVFVKPLHKIASLGPS